MRKFIAALLLWVASSLSHTAIATVTYIYTDPQGTPLAEADASGNVTATFDYHPYGAQAFGSTPIGPGYTGHVNDLDTGLVYMQARYYDPLAGRFLSIDPMSPLPGSTFNFNRFAYANNNPIRFIDPDGRCPWCIGAIVGAVSGAVLGGATAYVASGGSLRQTFAGAIGGSIGGLITGGSLGAGASVGSTIAISISAGIAGETATETAQNITEHGSNLKDYQYSIGKIAVAGTLGAVGGANAKLADVAAKGLGAAKKAIIAQSIAIPAQLISDQVTDHPENVLNRSAPGRQPKDNGQDIQQKKHPAPNRDYLHIQ